MKVLALIFLSTLKFGLSAFGFYDSKSENFTGILRPSVNINLKFNDFRLYSDFGLNAIKTEDSTDIRGKIYQCYLKYQHNGLEIKGGKILYIPGFPGLFNPFFYPVAFETVETEFEGEKGLFLRFINDIITPTLFYTFKESTSDIVKAQLSKGFSKFEIGVYSEIKKGLNIGGYCGYFGKLTAKMQSFLKDSILKVTASVEFPVRNTLLLVSFSHSSYPELTIIPANYMLTKNLLAVEVKFQDRIFEIPYFLCFLDIDNKTFISLLDYRYVMSNNVILETGFTLGFKETKINYAIYGGFKLTKGF
ncbi:MAG: hypothetical protein QMD82_02710 [bacterium]|nr:hypothetical protein [bacterium]